MPKNDRASLATNSYRIVTRARAEISGKVPAKSSYHSAPKTAMWAIHVEYQNVSPAKNVYLLFLLCTTS